MRRGETLAWADDPDQDIANVVSGAFKLVAASPDGVERTVGIILPGGFVGNPLVQGGGFTVIALADATVCAMSRRAVARMITRSPEFGAAMLRRTLADLDLARRWVTMIGGRSAQGRIASLLSLLAAQAEPEEPVPLPFSRGDMADLLGLSLETVSRRLHQLARDGVIALPDRRSFIVLEPGLLATAAA